MFDLQPLKNIFHLGKSLVANVVYGFPSRKITVIGVTGTDGKTTTSSLIYHILKSTGHRVSLISTVSATIGKQQYDTGFHTTTPSPFTVQKFIKQAVDDGDSYFILETTSHALDQYRVFGVAYSVGLITNITHEHLHYHRTYANYVKSKARLIQWARTAIINRDDQSYPLLKKLVDSSRVNKQVFTYSLNQNADFSFDISKKLGIPLAHFNKYNYLGAFAVCKQLGLTDDEIYTAMKTYELPPGRLEVIYDKSFKVIVDFAHTPNALHEALHAIRDEYVGRGRLIHIFGAAAFRDDTKRPLMGKESATYADTTILTEEDYRTEDPYQISKQIAEGMKKLHWNEVSPEKYEGENRTYTAIVSRKEAIQKALSIAKKGDVIVLTGKGHEQSLCRGTKEYPWDDKKETLDSLKKLEHTS